MLVIFLPQNVANNPRRDRCDVVAESEREDALSA